MTTTTSWVRRALVLAPLSLLSFTAVHGQSDDFGYDLTVEAEKTINKKWSVGLEGELRTRNNARTNDRWSAGLNVDYKIAKWLKASAGYVYLYDNNEQISYYDATDEAVIDGDAEVGDPKKRARYWGSRHRFNLSLTASRKLGNWKFSLRERWQYTYRPEQQVDQRWSYLSQAFDGKEKVYGGNGKNVLRSRFQIEYDKKGLALTPYAHVELFNAWSVQKTRYTAGLDWKLSKQHAIGFFYRYQTVRNDEDDHEPNIHLVGATYRFKF